MFRIVSLVRPIPDMYSCICQKAISVTHDSTNCRESGITPQTFKNKFMYSSTGIDDKKNRKTDENMTFTEPNSWLQCGKYSYTQHLCILADAAMDVTIPV